MSFQDLQKLVIKNDLCCRCGSCAGICPAQNIVFQDLLGQCLPSDLNKCINGCRLCIQVCPGYRSDVTSYQLGLGATKSIQLVRAIDKEVCRRGTSGGAVTSILAVGLNEKWWDGVLMLGYNPENPTQTMAKLLTTSIEVLDNTQSRYCVAPLNQILRKTVEGHRYAIVGLPCMLEGLDKWLAIQPKWRDRIVLKLGLLCHSTMKYGATQELLDKLEVTAHDAILQAHYREGAFPGGFKVVTHNSESKTIPLDNYMVLFNHYSLNRCRLCVDHYALHSDIAFADPFPFVDELKNGDLKWTTTVTRSYLGIEYLLRARTLGAIECRIVGDGNEKKWREKLDSIQQVHLRQIALTKKMNMPVPSMDIILPRVNFAQALLNLVRILVFQDIMLSAKQMIGRFFAGRFDPDYSRFRSTDES